MSRVYGIDGTVLKEQSLDHVCVSEKMSWATLRTTTRSEDSAALLTGLSGVTMPPLYATILSPR
jgi:hypothetical protein